MRIAFLPWQHNTPASTRLQAGRDSLTGKVELYDPAAASIIDSNAVVEVSDITINEGQARSIWSCHLKQMLLLSAVRENTIYRWNGADTPLAWLTPSGYTDTAFRDGENGSNGLTLDREGRLIGFNNRATGRWSG